MLLAVHFGAFLLEGEKPMASSLKAFFKENKKTKANVKYPATESICDEKGNPVEWEIRQLSAEEDEKIRDECTKEIQIPGKYGMTRTQLDANRYNELVAAKAIVFPDLFDADLQDSYGVKDPGALLKALVDNPGEYADLIQFIQKNNGYDPMKPSKVDEAKN